MPCVHDLPGVGRNLHDHFSTDIVWELNGPHSYDKYKKLHWKLLAGAEYLCSVPAPSPPTSSRAAPSGGATGARRRPTCSFISLPGAGVEKAAGTVPGGNGATSTPIIYAAALARQRAAALDDPADAPLIDPNSFAEPYDLDRSIDGIKISQEIGRSPSFRRFVDARIFPGEACKTKKDYEEVARANARSSYHPVGTCKMGSRRHGGGRLRDLRVRGIERLRVCDSSIMPRIVSSNTNAPTIAIAEKAADMIKGNR